MSAPIDGDATVVLYTDGLVERPGEHIDTGLDRLADVVRGATIDPQQLCDLLLTSWCPRSAAPDDVALLTLRTMPIDGALQRGAADRAGGARLDARGAAALAPERGGIDPRRSRR